MDVTEYQLGRALQVVSNLAEPEQVLLKELGPRDIRYMLSDRALTPAQERRHGDTRVQIEELFKALHIFDPVLQELILRIFVLGEDQMAKSSKAIKDSVTVVAGFPESVYNDPKHTQYAIGTLPVAKLPIPVIDSDFGKPHEIFCFLGPTWDLDKVCQILGKFHSFSDSKGTFEEAILKRDQSAWQRLSVGSDIAGAKANRKTLPPYYKHICEDGIFAFESASNVKTPFVIMGACDGVSRGEGSISTDSLCKWIFIEVLKSHITEIFSKSLSQIAHFPDDETLKTGLITAFQQAQSEMHLILNAIHSALTFDELDDHYRFTPLDDDKNDQERCRRYVNLAKTDSHLEQALRLRYLSYFSGSTTLELAVCFPGLTRGVLLRVGDGMTAVVDPRGRIHWVGGKGKLASIYPFLHSKHVLDKLKISPFEFSVGSTLMVTTDGLANNIHGLMLKTGRGNRIDDFYDGVEILAQMTKEKYTAKKMVDTLTDIISRSRLSHPDDVGFAIFRKQRKKK